MRLRGKRAIITGGTSGIGLATAKLFAQEGARVVISGRNRDNLDKAVTEIGSAATGIIADLGDLETPARLVDEAHAAMVGLDIIVANAAECVVTPLGATQAEVFERTMRTNVTSVFLLVQHAVPLMSDRGSIVLVGSINDVLGGPGWSAYAASKGGIRSMTRCMASELSPRGIRVNTLTPGGTRTQMWSTLAKPEEYGELERLLVRAVPLRRVGEAIEVARAALFLASDDASNIQAAEIVVDGGTSGAPGGAPIYAG
ncbi:SDR family NAD(P)-dependent oxidoreductase [Nitrobacter sp.]|uniref:SDR family NAD(P)-dependent oxidoreductase n=1 Tax=Nitrobacter sp. TaxID=29420 RepID=UPI0029CAB59B|nr:SDR family oxidoreductase [Nitrobacter sp.]